MPMAEVQRLLRFWLSVRSVPVFGALSSMNLNTVAILDAGRNSMSFFMLLVVSLGLNVVCESLGRTMLKCQALAAAHFIFGSRLNSSQRLLNTWYLPVLYAIGIVELELESTSALILLLFIIPLAFTLSGFLLWIMYALNGMFTALLRSLCNSTSHLATMAQLRARKQRYKLKMFERLYYILLFSVLIIGVFFVVSSMSFSGRLAEGSLPVPNVSRTNVSIKITPPRRGVCGGGSWMAGWLFYISYPLLRLHFFGDQQQITEDEYLSTPY